MNTDPGRINELRDLDLSRKPVVANVKACSFTKISKKINPDRSLAAIQRESLFEISLANGNRPNYIISKNPSQLTCGSGQKLHLKTATKKNIDDFFDIKSRSQADLLLKIAKQQRIKIDKDTTPLDIKDQLLIDYDPDDPECEILFYELTTPVPEEDILRLSSNSLQVYLDLSLTGGVLKDPRLNLFFRGMVPIVNPELLESPSEVMASNPHAIFITYTKTGKTTTAWKLGTVHDRPTPANLLGFSTAQKGSQREGTLNNKVHLQTIDDISEFREDEFSVKGLLNFLEKGDVLVSRGYGSNTKGYCTILLTSNPLQDKEIPSASPHGIYNAETILRIQEIVNRIHDNPSAIGSRFGLILFFPNMEPADASNKVSYTMEDNLLKVLQTLQQMLADPFTRLLKHETIREWLSTSNDPPIKQYRSRISQLLKDERVKEISWTMHQFLDGLKANYCHLRGFPFRQAVIDHIYDLIHLKSDDELPDELIKEILAKANEHLQETLDVLVYPSLQNITMMFSSDVKDSLLRLHYNNLARYPQYETVLLHTVAEFALQNKVDSERIIPLADVKDAFLNVIREDRNRLWFNTFPKFFGIIEENQKAIIRHRGDLKFTLQTKDGVLCLILPPVYDWFSYVRQQPVISSSKNIAENAHEENDQTSFTDLKISPKTSKEPTEEFETSPKTPKSPNSSENIGEMGGLDAISKSMGTNDKRNQSVGEMGDDLVGFETIKKNHVEWAALLIENNPEFPLSAFRLKFQKQWGPDIPDSEIKTVYQTVKKNVEQKKKVDKK